MNVSISVLALVIGAFNPHAQVAEATVAELYEAADIQPRRILLLGTFHFKDTGLDADKPWHEFDALSERRPEAQEQKTTRSRS